MSDAATCCLTALMQRSQSSSFVFSLQYTCSFLRDVLALGPGEGRAAALLVHDGLELDLARLLRRRLLRDAAGAKEQ